MSDVKQRERVILDKAIQRANRKIKKLNWVLETIELLKQGLDVAKIAKIQNTSQNYFYIKMFRAKLTNLTLEKNDAVLERQKRLNTLNDLARGAKEEIDLQKKQIQKINKIL